MVNPDKLVKRSLCASGAGGAIGFLLGALMVLVEHGYRHAIAIGVSSGGILALMYAMGRLERMLELLSTIEDDDVANKRLLAWGFRLGTHKLGLSDPLHGAYDNRPLLELLKREMIGQTMLIDFVCVSVNSKTGREMWWQIPAGTTFSKGDVEYFAKMVLSTTAIPGVFGAVEIGGEYYTDGGSSTHTPIEPTKIMMPDADHITILSTAGFEAKPLKHIKSDLDHAPERASDVLAKVAEVDFLKFHYKNELAKCGCRDDLTYYPSTIVKPEQELAPTTRFHHKYMVPDIVHGREMALKALKKN